MSPRKRPAQGSRPAASTATGRLTGRLDALDAAVRMNSEDIQRMSREIRDMRALLERKADQASSRDLQMFDNLVRRLPVNACQ